MKNVQQILLSGPEQFPEIKKTIQVTNTPKGDDFNVRF